MHRRNTVCAALLAGASLIALATPASASRVIFSSASVNTPQGDLPPGPVEVAGGVTQIATDTGGMISFVGAAKFTIGADGGVSIQSGRVTVAAGSGPVRLSLPGGGEIAVDGAGSAASFGVDSTGAVTGRPLAGSVSITSGGVTRTFASGQAFSAPSGGAAGPLVTAGVQPVSAPAPGGLIDQPSAESEVLTSSALLPTQVGGLGVPLAQNPAVTGLPQTDAGDLLNLLLAQTGQGAPAFDTLAPTLLSAQVAYLRGGGAPGSFDASSAAALVQAYARFLGAGGSAAAFPGVALGQLQAYLAYLNTPGVQAALDAATRAQLAAYQQLAASGVSDLSGRAAAQSLAAYVAYLQSGGAAAGYGATSDAVLRAYLDYLRAFGLPAGLDASTASILQTYLAYLQAGGAFGTVPVAPAPVTTTPVTTTPTTPATTPTTTTPVTTPVTTPTTPTTSTGLGTGATRLATAVAGLYAGGPADPGAPTVTLDANGRPTNLGYYGAPGTATLTDVQTGSGWLIGRFANGTFGSGSNTQTYGPNTGAHFVVQTPVTAIPTSGTLFYKTTAYTAPTQASGVGFSATAVDINLGVTFGSAPKFGFNGLVSLNSGSFGFSTAGGAAAPSLTNVFTPTGEIDLYGTAPLTSLTGGLCASMTTCKVNANFAGGGAGVATFGVAYGLVDSSNVATVIGAALLTQTATAGSAGMASSGSTGGGGTTVGTSGASPASGANISFSAQGPNVNRSAVTGTTVSDGAAATLASATVSSSSALTRNTAVDADNGGVAGVVGWTRWTSGTAIADGANVALTANQGIHIAYGAPLTAMPTSGTATYTLAGATKPTFSDGSAAPGVFTGQIGVAFATLKVGWDSTVVIGGSTYAFNSSGGSAAPSVTLGSDGRWIGSSVPANGYSGRAYGFLAGAGASHAGMTYFISPSGAGPTITGAAAFSKQ